MASKIETLMLDPALLVYLMSDPVSAEHLNKLFAQRAELEAMLDDRQRYIGWISIADQDRLIEIINQKDPKELIAHIDHKDQIVSILLSHNLQALYTYVQTPLPEAEWKSNVTVPVTINPELDTIRRIVDNRDIVTDFGQVTDPNRPLPPRPQPSSGCGSSGCGSSNCGSSSCGSSGCGSSGCGTSSCGTNSCGISACGTTSCGTTVQDNEYMAPHVNTGFVPGGTPANPSGGGGNSSYTNQYNAPYQQYNQQQQTQYLYYYPNTNIPLPQPIPLPPMQPQQTQQQQAMPQQTQNPLNSIPQSQLAPMQQMLANYGLQIVPIGQPAAPMPQPTQTNQILSSMLPQQNQYVPQAPPAMPQYQPAQQQMPAQTPNPSGFDSSSLTSMLTGAGGTGSVNGMDINSLMPLITSMMQQGGASGATGGGAGMINMIMPIIMTIISMLMANK